MSGSQLITWPMPPTSCEISTFVTPLPPPHAIWVTYDKEDPLRRGVMSEYEYDLGHQTLHTSKHLQSFPTYSDTLHSKLQRPCNITSPLVSVPLHVLPLCLFVCLFILTHWCHVSLALFVFFLKLLPLCATHPVRIPYLPFNDNSSPSTSRDHPLVAQQKSIGVCLFAHALTAGMIPAWWLTQNKHLHHLLPCLQPTQLYPLLSSNLPNPHKDLYTKQWY